MGQTTPEQRAYALGMEGIRLIDEGKPDDGIKLLKKARVLQPQDYDYALEIGKAYLYKGEPKKAEKYFFDLQYHSGAQADLYLLLAKCYAELELLKKAPEPEHKKELDALRYGIQKLPSEGILYLELGRKKLEMDDTKAALAVWEKGIMNAPNFAENYFWAAKTMSASGNQLWAWIYAETCFNLTEDNELMRAAALLAEKSLNTVLEADWKADPEKLDQDLKFTLTQKCATIGTQSADHWEERTCLLQHWNYAQFVVAPLFQRMQDLKDKGFLRSYTASMMQETDKEQFLKWLAANAVVFETYRTWRYWNPMHLDRAISRLEQN